VPDIAHDFDRLGLLYGWPLSERFDEVGAATSAYPLSQKAVKMSAANEIIVTLVKTVMSLRSEMLDEIAPKDQLEAIAPMREYRKPERHDGGVRSRAQSAPPAGRANSVNARESFYEARCTGSGGRERLAPNIPCSKVCAIENSQQVKRGCMVTLRALSSVAPSAS